jgi:hypothetical protein
VGTPDGVLTLRYFTVVWVAEVSRVKLTEGFVGNWPGRFPQYLTRAILLGACQLVVPSSGSVPAFPGIKSFSIIHRIFAKICL